MTRPMSLKSNVERSQVAEQLRSLIEDETIQVKDGDGTMVAL